MILMVYIVLGVLAIILIAISRSEKVMSIFTISHTLSYLALSIYIAIYYKFPIFFTNDKLFFIDTFALYEVILASFIFFLASVYLRGYMLRMIEKKELNPKNIRIFNLGFSLLFMVVILAFFSNNLALFWIFLELTTIFSVLLITLVNTKENIVAGLHYIFIVSPAMIFSFIGLIILYVATQSSGNPTLNWFDIMHITGVVSPRIVELSFIFIFIGFAAKSGIVPFHNWLPRLYSKAPSPVSVLLSATISSLGIYGIIRVFSIVNQTIVLTKISWILITFGVASLAIASLTMLQKKNVKMILAFSSIEQIGIILIAIGIATKISLFWAIIYMTLHSIVKALLFFSAGVINSQYQSNDLESIHDMIKLQPLASIGLILGSLAIIGLPPFLLFIPKFFLLTEFGKYSIILLAIVLFFILLAISALTILMTKLFSNVTLSDTSTTKITKYVPTLSMNCVIIILIVIIIVLGIYIPLGLQNIVSGIVTQLGF